jgi:hypothetical protein
LSGTEWQQGCSQHNGEASAFHKIPFGKPYYLIAATYAWFGVTRIRCHIRVNLLGYHKGRDVLRPGSLHLFIFGE